MCIPLERWGDVTYRIQSAPLVYSDSCVRICNAQDVEHHGSSDVPEKLLQCVRDYVPEQLICNR